MSHKFTTIIKKEGKWYVVYCVETGVATQGKTIEEAQKNIKEAMELYLEDQPNLKKEVGNQPFFVSTLELDYA